MNLHNTKRLSARRVYLILCAVNGLLFGMIFTASTVYQVQTVGLSALQLVLVGTTVELTAFLFEVPTGVVADVYSRRLSIIIGVALNGVAFLLEGSFAHFGTILVAQVLAGIGYTFTSGATEAWIVDEVGVENAAGILLRGSQMGSLGGIGGVLAAMALGSLALNLPLVLGGVLLIGLAVFLRQVMPETGFKPTPREERNSWQVMGHTLRSGVALVRGRAVLMSIVGIALVYGLYSEGVDRLWWAHLSQTFTLPTFAGLQPIVWSGAIRIGTMFASLAMQELVRRYVVTDTTYRSARVLFAFNAIMVVSLMAFGLAETFAAALIAMYLFTMLRSVSGPIFSAWSNQHIDSSVRATVLSMFSQLDAIGQTAGGPFVGIIGNLSLRAALVFAGLVLSPVLLLYRRVMQQDEIVVPEVPSALA